MTQSQGPGITIAPDNIGGARIASLEESYADNANPFAPNIPEAPARPAAGEAGGYKPLPPLAETMAAREEQYSHDQAILEAQRSKGETGATQYLRGALGALLTPGTIAGWQAETAGALLNAPARFLGQQDNPTFKALEDFGRSLGKASTGRSAIEALGATGELVFGSGAPEDVTSAADMARIAVDEQEKAWPLLSTAAQAAGALTVGIASGAGVGGGAKGLAALGAIEGSAAGAQAAYDVDAPLTEVWTSAALGGTLGAGLSQAPAVVTAAARKGKGALAKVFGGEGSTLTGAVEERIAKSIGVRKGQWKKLGDDEVHQMARDIDEYHFADGTPLFPKRVLDAAKMTQDDIASGLEQARQEVGAKLGQVVDNASDFIDAQAPHMRIRPGELADQIDREVVARYAGSLADEMAAPAQRIVAKLRGLGDEMSIRDFKTQRELLDDLIYEAKTGGSKAEALTRSRGIIEDAIANRIDAVADATGDATYRQLKRQYKSFATATKIADDTLADAGNRFLSPSDNAWALGALLMDASGGMGLATAAKTAAAAFGHKLIRERGSAISAALLRRFQRTPAAVDVAVAGGREAQEAMTEIVRTKNFLRETADAAGPNPSVGAVAGNTAEDAAATELAKRAGTFDPTAWATAAKAPKPLARLLYRTQILDTVSQDLAPTVERVATLRPGLDFDVSPEKLSRLVKDADGPQAIGLVQQRVREVADSVPGSPLLPALEASLQRLDTADVAGAVTEAHNVARMLAANGAETDARSLLLTLGGDEFGQAGKLYQQLAATPGENLRALADPTKLRETLRTLELRGQLTQQIAEENRTALAAFEARARLTGEPVPAEARQQMRAIEELWSKGEEAVTLDGTRLGRVVDALNNLTESRVASKVPRVPEDQQVAEAIKGALKYIEPSIKRGSGSKRGRAIVQAALRAPSRLLTHKERIVEYESRLERLSQAVVAPDMEQQTAAISEAPVPVRAAVTQAQTQKLQTLMRDMPKPRSDIHGTAYSSMSSEDIRRGLAMWDATMEPLSVFEDFRRGDVDYDKVSYAWKQYPGLQRLAQLGTLDMLQSQLSADELNSLPDSTLTQLDYLLGFKGGLQSSVSIQFSQRIDGVHQQIQQEQGGQPPPPNRGLTLPTSKPTMTQRISGAQ